MQERCSTVIEFQDEERREGYLQIAETAPSMFFYNDKPILLMNGKMSKIWGAIRKIVMTTLVIQDLIF